MPKRNSENLRRVHLWVFEEDWIKIKEIFGAKIGESKAVRLMIRSCLNQLEAKALSNARPASGEAAAAILGAEFQAGAGAEPEPSL